MNSNDLAKIIAKKEKISQPKAKKLIQAFIDVVEKALKEDKKIVFSNFGSLIVYQYPSKTIRHPRRNDHKILMLPTNVVKWHPSIEITKRIKGNAVFENDSKMTKEISSEPVEAYVMPVDQSNASQKPEEIKISKLEEKTNSLEKPTEPEKPVVTPKKETESSKINPISFEDMVKESENKAAGSQPTANKPAEALVEIKKTETDTVATPDNIVILKKDTPATATNVDKSKVEPPAKTRSLSDADVSEATKADYRPKTSFEAFVQKSKEDVLSTAAQTEAESVPKKSLKEIDASEFTDQKPKSMKPAGEENQFVGNVTIEFADLSKTTIDKKVLSLIPEKFARQYQVVPISDNGDVLTVGMVDPEDLETIELVKKQTGREVIPKLTVQADLNHILDQYTGVESEVNEAITQTEQEAKETGDKDEEQSSKQQKIVEDAPVSRIVQSLIKRAVRDQASDIHIEPSEAGIDVRYRIDGILQKKVSIPKDIQASVISRVKILAGIKIDESRLPQDGRIQLLIDNRKVDFRVSTLPTAFGEKIVLRILDKSSGILSLEQLGLRGHGFDVVENSIHKSHGMTLVTGPTGSGKTTTLYAIIDRLLNVAVNIVTLEDPIEYQMAGVNQSQVNADINYNFANGLRSILRQDPDVVMIGEIRDKETAEMAVNAALTGHIVLSTLHTNDSAGAGPRLIDMGVEPFLITSSLNTVLGQRLSRRLCPNCKEETKVTDKELEEVNKEIDRMPEAVKKRWQGKKLVFFKGKGCSECHDTGYKGRLGIFEVLDVNQKIQDLLLHRETSSKITESAIADGMLTMKQDGIDKALDGLTSLEEVWRVTKD